MQDIIQDVGFEGDFPEFLAFLRTDPQFYAETPKELLAHASYYAKKIDGRLPMLFGRLPRQPYGVAPGQPFQRSAMQKTMMFIGVIAALIFVSVIAAFALVGIALGVGTLIVVLAVMNGFRSELLGRVLGVNGHATIVAGPQGLVDDAALVTRLRDLGNTVIVVEHDEEAILAADHVVETRYLTAFQEHAALERESALGTLDEQGLSVAEVWVLEEARMPTGTKVSFEINNLNKE